MDTTVLMHHSLPPVWSSQSVSRFDHAPFALNGSAHSLSPKTWGDSALMMTLWETFAETIIQDKFPWCWVHASPLSALLPSVLLAPPLNACGPACCLLFTVSWFSPACSPGVLRTAGSGLHYLGHLSFVTALIVCSLMTWVFSPVNSNLVDDHQRA